MSSKGTTASMSKGRLARNTSIQTEVSTRIIDAIVSSNRRGDSNVAGGQTRAVAAQKKARTELETDVSTARESAQADVHKLRETVRTTIQERKAKHQRERAERDADDAEGDALYAIDYAYAAIEEAEYAVLQAELARMDADTLETVK